MKTQKMQTVVRSLSLVGILSLVGACGAATTTTKTRGERITIPQQSKTEETGKLSFLNDEQETLTTNDTLMVSDFSEQELGCNPQKPQFIGTKPQCTLVPNSCDSLVGKGGFIALNVDAADAVMPDFLKGCEAKLKEPEKSAEDFAKNFTPPSVLDWAQCGRSGACEVVQKTPQEIESLIPEEVKALMKESAEQE